MSDLIAWLRGCLDDEERVARAASTENGPTWYVGGERDVLADNPSDTPYVACGPWGGGIDAATADHIARHDPARVLAEVDAKRRILDEHGASGGTCRTCCGEPDREVRWDGEEEAVEWARADKPWPCPTVRLLAQPYAGRDGWREEWRT